jgi:hypothetical protein
MKKKKKELLKCLDLKAKEMNRERREGKVIMAHKSILSKKIRRRVFCLIF